MRTTLLIIHKLIITPPYAQVLAIAGNGLGMRQTSSLKHLRCMALILLEYLCTKTS
jgi:hypothetical protein